jgi:diguanylate cyclase (GGDEF)-like protein
MESLTHEARVSGLRPGGLPSYEQVERRRFELWLVSTMMIVGLTLAVALLSLWHSEAQHELLRHDPVRYGLTVFAVVICGYLIEKEISLRRVSHRLVDERTLSLSLSSRLREITALLDAGRAVNSALELDHVLAAILRGSIDLFPAATGSIMLLDGGELVVAASAGNDSAAGARVAIGNAIAGHVAESREPLLINGAATEHAFPGYTPRAERADSALSAPLIERDELLGVLNVSAAPDRTFSEYDLRAVSLFAEHAAAAIAKARLYEAHLAHAADMAYRAVHDPLTSLPNRTALEAAIDDSVAADQPMALLFIDLDGFKEINDTHGHQAGDVLLAAAAARMQASVGSEDLAARLGGDEFAVVLRGVTDGDVATQVARRLLDSLVEPFSVEGQLVRISASVGVSIAGVHGSDFASLLRAADRALYAAKAAGKGCSCVLDPITSEPEISRPTEPAPPIPMPRQATVHVLPTYRLSGA